MLHDPLQRRIFTSSKTLKDIFDGSGCTCTIGGAFKVPGVVDNFPTERPLHIRIEAPTQNALIVARAMIARLQALPQAPQHYQAPQRYPAPPLVPSAFSVPIPCPPQPYVSRAPFASQSVPVAVPNFHANSKQPSRTFESKVFVGVEYFDGDF